MTAAIISSQLQAQDSTARSLDEVVVTATKSGIKQSQTGKVITVIDRATLDRSLGKDLAQVLTEQAAIAINGATSNTGKDKTVFLRGAKNDYTVILINGIPVTDPSGVAGAFDPRMLPVDQIERIEIVKGAQSTLYGSNAVAGVINIITRKGGDKTAQLSANLSAGSYNSYKANAALNGSVEKLSYSVGFIHNESDGISEAKDTAAVKTFDKDGFNQNAVYVNADGEVIKRLHLKPWFRYTKFKAGYDDGGFTDDASRYASTLLSAGAAAQWNFAKGSITAQYGYDEITRSYFSATYNSDTKFEGTSKIAELYATYNLTEKVRLLAGIDHRRQVSTDSNAHITSPYFSIFAHGIGGWLNVEAGGRYNHHSRYGDNFTYSFNPSAYLMQKLKVFANIASAFRAPALTELYGPYGSNPDLKPERSATVEGGIQFSKSILDIRAVYFLRHTRNIIISGPTYVYMNLDKQKDHGIEIEPTLIINKTLQLKMYYAFVDGEVTTQSNGKDTSYFNLFRRPRHSLGLTANYQLTKKLFLNTNIYSYGKRTDIFFNNATFTSSPVELNSYLLWNMYAEYAIIPNRLKVFADVKNILNKDYYEVYGYSTQGTNVNGGVVFRL